MTLLPMLAAGKNTLWAGVPQWPRGNESVHGCSAAPCLVQYSRADHAASQQYLHSCAVLNVGQLAADAVMELQTHPLQQLWLAV